MFSSLDFTTSAKLYIKTLISYSDLPIIIAVRHELDMVFFFQDYYLL